MTSWIWDWVLALAVPQTQGQRQSLVRRKMPLPSCWQLQLHLFFRQRLSPHTLDMTDCETMSLTGVQLREQVGQQSIDSGKRVIKALSSALWYIEPHHERLQQQGARVPPCFSAFQGNTNRAVLVCRLAVAWYILDINNSRKYAFLIVNTNNY